MHAEIADADPAFLALDDGEKAALALGLSLKADLILIDERKGAAVARQKGLQITGTLGVLVLAGRRPLIDLADAFARLRRTSFHCSESIMTGLLARETICGL